MGKKIDGRVQGEVNKENGRKSNEGCDSSSHLVSFDTHFSALS